MATYSDLVKTVTQSAYYALLMARHAANKVPTDTWLSVVNVGLSTTQYVAELLAQLRALITGTFQVLFLEEWQGLLDDAADDAERAAIEDRITVVARNLYGVEREKPQLQLARFVLISAAAAPTQTLEAGLVAGTPGPAGLLWYAEEPGTLEPGRKTVLLFRAAEAGSLYNIPVGTPLEFKTSLVGVTIANPASGPGTIIGLGNAGLRFHAAQDGVSVYIIDPSMPNQALSVSDNIVTKVLTISLATDGSGTLISTAEDVRKEVSELVVDPGFGVGQLVIACLLAGNGAGIVQPTIPVALDWDGSYIEEAGADQEPAQRLKRRCETRLDTTGGGGGMGLPPGAVGTEDALVFWGLARPASYKSSPVRWVRVLSNNHLGTISGGESTVVLASAAGALSSKDVAAVAANYENPKKYWGGLNVVSATTLNISITGTVYVRAASGKSLSEVRDSVAQSLADYQQIVGEDWSKNLSPVLRPQKIGARIEDADKVAIDYVDLVTPSSPTVLAWNQFPGFDISGLVFAYV